MTLANTLLKLQRTSLYRRYSRQVAIKRAIPDQFRAFRAALSLLHRSDATTVIVVSQPSLISFKRVKNKGNILVRCSLQSDSRPGTFKCAHGRCKACPFIYNIEKIRRTKESIKITEHFMYISADFIYCMSRTYNKVWI